MWIGKICLVAEQQQIIREGIPRRAAVSDALAIVQKKNGWVSDSEQVENIASFLHMTPAEVDSIATFYSQAYRRPVGAHAICLCDSVCATSWSTKSSIAIFKNA